MFMCFLPNSFLINEVQVSWQAYKIFQNLPVAYFSSRFTSRPQTFTVLAHFFSEHNLLSNLSTTSCYSFSIYDVCLCILLVFAFLLILKCPVYTLVLLFFPIPIILKFLMSKNYFLL